MKWRNLLLAAMVLSMSLVVVGCKKPTAGDDASNLPEGAPGTSSYPGSMNEADTGGAPSGGQ